jgi:DNA-binding MarR family transcriptional regulator
LRHAKARQSAKAMAASALVRWPLIEIKIMRTTRTRVASGGNSTDDKTIRYGTLGTLIEFNLRLAHTASAQSFGRLTGGVSGGENAFAVLSLIRDNPGISQTLLSQANAKDKSSLTPTLNELAKRGLVIRQRMPGNLRTYSLTLTGAGITLHKQLAALAMKHEQQLTRLVGKHNRAKLVKLLRLISNGVPDAKGHRRPLEAD